MNDESGKRYHDEWPNFEAALAELKRQGREVVRVEFVSRPPAEDAEPDEGEAEL